MQRSLFITLVLIAAAAHAQLTLGPEQPATPFEPQTPQASFAAMASSANGSLVIFQTTVIHGQLLDADGRPLTQHGFPITSSAAKAGGVASNGSNYVVAVTDNKKVQVITVSLTGEVSTPRDVATFFGNIDQARVASNGHGYLVTFVATSLDGRPVVCGHNLDGDGVPAGTVIPISPSLSSVAGHTVASNGGDYLASYTIADGWPPDPAKASEVSFVPVVGNFTRDRKSGMHRLLQIGSGPNYLVAFNEPNDTHAYAALADASGVLGERNVIGDGDVVSVAGNVVLLRDKNGAFQAVSLAGTSAAGSRPLAIAGGDAFLGVTSRGEPVAVRTGQALLEIAVLLPGPLAWRPLVTLGTTQWGPQLVNAGDVDVLTWSEASGARVTRLRHGVPIDVPALHVAPAGTIAIGGEGRALLVWQQDEWRGRILAADGTLSPPFTIAAADGPLLHLWSAVWNGRSFIVAWAGKDGLWCSRIDAAGNVLGTAPLDLAVTPSGGLAVSQWSVQLLPASFGFLLLYQEQIATPQRRVDVFAAAFRDDGTPLGGRVPVRASIDAESLISTAGDGKGHLLAAISVVPANGSEPRLDFIPLDERGNVTGDGSSLGRGFGWLVWDGTEFLLLGAGSGSGAVLDVHGRLVKPLDPLPIPLSPSLFTPEAVAYDRVEDGDVTRVYVRRIIPPRRHAARP